MTKWKLINVIIILLINVSIATAENIGDLSEFERWCDAFVAEYDGGQNAPISIVVVKDDQIFFQKGYGFLDSKQTIPVTADKTIFRAASVSKLFTTVAVLKLVEQGKINLDADINTYLKDFKIKQKFQKPITVADLLMHTSGLEERMFGNVEPAGTSPSLKEVFSQNVLREIRPAGEEIVYSNLGMALAGYIVEAVSGQKFEDYVEQEIFKPLQMNHSNFRQPYPKDLADSVVPSGADDVALKGYPAGSLISTASDMGKFLQMQLNGGKPILNEETIREMQKRHFTQDEKIPGIAYGFFEHFANGRRILFHTGASGHQSLLAILPDEKVGLYIALSATQGGKFQEFRKDFLQAFLDRYFPSKEASLPTSKSNHSQIEGTYRPHLLSPLTIEKLGNLALDTSVNDNGDGSITVAFPPFGSTKMRFLKIAPNVFRSDPGTYAAFDNGKMFTSGELNDPVPFGKISFYESGILHLVLFIVGAAFYGLICLVSIFFAIKNLVRKSKNSIGNKRIRRLAVLTSWLFILSPIFAVLYYLIGDSEQRPFKVGTALTIGNSVLVLAVLAGILTAILVVKNWSKLIKREKIWLLPFAIISLSAIPFLYYWNLLGFSF